MGESRTTEVAMSGALFREIHKNAWLKRMALSDTKKLGALSKKGDRVWVVFCVHDDTEAFLEGYSDVKLSATHVPDWFVCLNTTLHVSPTICPHEQEYEFVVTLTTEVLRLMAPSWESMQEWVDTLRSKLREMRIISPRENVYSRLPEVRPPLLPTRDPTSPLPAPPPVPAAMVPGVETIPQHSDTQNSVTAVSNPATFTTAAPLTQYNSETNSLRESNNSNTIIEEVINSDSATDNRYLLVNESSSNNNSLSSFNINSESSSTVKTNILDEIDSESDDMNCDNDNVHLSFPTHTSLYVADSISIRRCQQFLHAPFANNIDTPTVSESHCSDVTPQASSSNITIIQVSNPPHSAIPVTSSQGIFNFNFTQDNILENQPLVINNSYCDSDNIVSLQNNTAEIFGSSAIKATQRNQNVLVPDVTLQTGHSTNVQIIPSSSIEWVGQGDNLNIDHNTNSRLTSNVDLSYRSNIDLTTHISNSSNSSPNISSKPKIVKSKPSLIQSDIILSSPAKSATPGYGQVAAKQNVSIKTKANFNSSITPSTSSSNDASNNTSDQHYERVFLSHNPIQTSASSSNVTAVNVASRVPPKSPKFSLLSKQQRSVSHSELQINRNRLRANNPNAFNNLTNTNITPKLINEQNMNTYLNEASTSSNPSHTQPNVNQHERRFVVPSAKISNTESLGLSLSPQPRLTRGLTELQISRPLRGSNIQNAENSTNIEEKLPQEPNRNVHDSPIRYQPARVIEGESRRRSQSTSEPLRPVGGVSLNQRMASIEGRRGSGFRPEGTPPRLTLREQQVLQLRREMQHPGGVRLTLRKKDCVASIALVDAFGAVWIAGWKQREHPMLYNALHIGDRLISAAGVVVNNASEANKAIRTAVGIYVELIIRRVPFGRVYAIRKESDGQCLGLIQDSNTATIVDIVPNSLVARHGLPPRVQTCDGLSLTSWVLTEINGRPLNLFFKENEVRDRLNAVGREISILVQPLDLIKQLKKQLKNLRSHKDYIVQ